MKGYRKYFTKKIIWFLITFVSAILLNFILPRMMPQDPVAIITTRSVMGTANPAAVAQMYAYYQEQFGLDKSLPEQFVIFVGNFFRGELGTSFSQYPRKVSDIIVNALPWTLCLQLPAIIVGWLIGNVLGALAAYIRKGFDKVIMPVSLLISGVPAFGLA
ncbi:MAG: ABC transporter permease, partial [Clostridiales bacterium]|nr:ABC transporter permease [Clostridiales bacterium]